MANIEIQASGYSGAYGAVNGTTQVPISLLSLLRCVVTVGYRSEADVLGYGWRSIGWHLATCFLTAAVTAENNGNLVVSRLFRSLDSSEKNTVSYRLGMGLTKLAAERKLQVPWLIHAERLQNAGSLTLSSGSLERGDLVGKDVAGAWHVFEAKGRSNQPSSRLMRKAKRQASRVQTVNGTAPATKSASIAHLYRDPVRIELVDPDEKLDAQASMTVSDREFFPTYYALLLQLLESTEAKPLTIGGIRFSIASLHVAPGVTVGFGLANEIRQEPSRAIDFPRSVEAVKNHDRESEKISIGLDGVVAAVV